MSRVGRRSGMLSVVDEPTPDDDSMAAPAPAPPPTPGSPSAPPPPSAVGPGRATTLERAAWALLAALVLGSVASTVAAAREADRTASAFFDATRRGDLAELDAISSPRNRRTLPTAVLEDLVAPAVFSRWDTVAPRGRKVWGTPPLDETCLVYDVRANDTAFRVELRLARDVGVYRVADFAAARRAEAAPHLLDACGPRPSRWL